MDFRFRKMLSILWNAAQGAKKHTTDYFFAGVHTVWFDSQNYAQPIFIIIRLAAFLDIFLVQPSDPSYRDDPTRVTGNGKRVIVGSHSSGMSFLLCKFFEFSMSKAGLGCDPGFALTDMQAIFG